MAQGSVASFVFMLKLSIFILRILGLCLETGYAQIVLLLRWVGKKCRRSPQLDGVKIHKFPETFRSVIQWTITIDGQVFRISSIEDLPDKYREAMRARLTDQAEGIRQILGSV